MNNPNGNPPRPVFVYGTLCALPLLAWALTGNAQNTDEVVGLLHKAKINGYKRVSVHRRDYPAIIECEGSSVEGFVLFPLTYSQKQKLDFFEGDTFKVVPVAARLYNDSTTNEDGSFDALLREVMDVDVHLWDGDEADLVHVPWDFDVFMDRHLADWIELFDGMVLVGSVNNTIDVEFVAEVGHDSIIVNSIDGDVADGSGLITNGDHADNGSECETENEDGDEDSDFQEVDSDIDTDDDDDDE